MAKVGIITIQRSELNFGACLQSFALWKYITELGHDCKVIDLLRPCHAGYRTSPSFNEKDRSLRGKFRMAVRRLLRRKKAGSRLFAEKKARFARFNGLPAYTETYRSVEELYRAKPVFDVYVTGSDQVWNPDQNFIKDPYFLTFAPTGAKKLSYASSFGTGQLPEGLKPRYGAWLSDYAAISTREASGARIVEELTGKRATVVMDPVFLLPAEQWLSYAERVDGLDPGAFVFLYLLHHNEAALRYAASVAKERGFPLYFVLSEDKRVEVPDARQLLDVGPKEWLWLVANAGAFVTTSFHGLAFSLIFRESATVLMKKGVPTNARIDDLLSAAGLQCARKDVLPDVAALSVSGGDKDRLAALIGESREYLKREI